MIYSMKMADSTRKQTPAHSSFNVAYYWTGYEWRETPVLFSFEYTRYYFRRFDGGRVIRFGVKGCPPADAPSQSELRSLGIWKGRP